MTDDRLQLKALLDKASDTELLSEMLAFVANRLMALDVEALCNAEPHERTDGRVFECKDIGEMMTLERDIRQACQALSNILETCSQFDGIEVVEFDQAA